MAIVCCGAQLDIPKRFDLLKYGNAQGAPVPIVEAPVAVQEEVVAVAPAPTVARVAQPVGALQALQYGTRIQQLGAPNWNPIHAYRTQQILPIQDLDVRGGQDVLQVSSFLLISLTRLSNQNICSRSSLIRHQF